MKALFVIFSIAVLLGVAACGVTFPAASPTPAVITLPASSGVAASGRTAATGAQPAATRVQAAPAPSGSPTATPTWVLSAPLSSVLPQASATSTPVPTPVLPTPTNAPLAMVASDMQPAAPAPAPAANPGGRFVIQLASGGDIITVNADGTGQKRLAAGLDPSWSRDGTQIAFASWNEPQGIYVMNADGSNLHMVYQINGAKNPVWSPDDGTIAFTWKYKSVQRTNRHGDAMGVPQDYWRISMVNLSNGNKTDMPMDPDLHAFAPDWSANGQMAYQGLRGLFVSDMTDTPWEITQYPLDTTPVWSPDGTRLALATYKQDHWEIAVVNADGSNYTQITFSPTTLGAKPVNSVAPRWSPDGKSIAFVSDRDGAWHMYIMDPDGSNQRLLLDTAITYQFADERVFGWTK